MEHHKPKPSQIELPHHSYQPTRAELREVHQIDATFAEVVTACLKPVKIRYVKPRKSKPQR